MNSPNVNADKVFEGQIRFIYGQTWSGVVGSAAGALTLCYILWDYIDHRLIQSWCGVFLLFLLYRAVLYIAFQRQLAIVNTGKSSSALNYSFWGSCYLVSIFLSGACWGFIGYFLFFDLPPEYVAAIALWALATGTIGASGYSIYYKAMYLYLIPLIVPVVICMLMLNSKLYTSLAFGLVIAMVIMMFVLRLINQYMVSAIHLNAQLENEILERKKIEDRLLVQSRIDSMTGLANRGFFNETLDSELRRAQRDKNPLSLIMIDVDYFKHFNDTYGHLDGDRCLQLISSELEQVVKRKVDLVARYGGEEFAVILPNIDKSTAAVIAENIRVSIAKLEIPHQSTLVKNRKTVTVSAGVITLHPKLSTTMTDIIGLADEALYQAKDNGRNQNVSIDNSKLLNA